MLVCVCICALARVPVALNLVVGATEVRCVPRCRLVCGLPDWDCSCQHSDSDVRARELSPR